MTGDQGSTGECLTDHSWRNHQQKHGQKTQWDVGKFFIVAQWSDGFEHWIGLREDRKPWILPWNIGAVKKHPETSPLFQRFLVLKSMGGSQLKISSRLGSKHPKFPWGYSWWARTIPWLSWVFHGWSKFPPKYDETNTGFCVETRDKTRLEFLICQWWKPPKIGPGWTANLESSWGSLDAWGRKLQKGHMEGGTRERMLAPTNSR
jgi:hypothetical protein